jgi:nucleotide-binding universal stress UspA family protein
MPAGRTARSVIAMSEIQPVTVVGYDGSQPAQRALEYAIDRLGHGSLCIVHAWHPPEAMRGSETYPVLAAASLAQAQALIDELPARHPRLERVAWAARSIEGHPYEVLVEQARRTNAAEIVVGTHGHGRMRAVLGSTAHALLHGSPCPVVVVPALEHSWPLPSAPVSASARR